MLKEDSQALPRHMGPKEPLEGCCEVIVTNFVPKGGLTSVGPYLNSYRTPFVRVLDKSSLDMTCG